MGGAWLRIGAGAGALTDTPLNWINNLVRPKIRGLLTKREIPENLWIKCPETGEMVFHRDLEANHHVVPGSGYHMRMTAPQRLKHFFDDAAWQAISVPEVVADPLKFRDERRYTDRLKEARQKSGQADSVLLGKGSVEGVKLVAAAHDMNFIGGSLGMAAGEAIVAGLTEARVSRLPFVMFSASGGARMQEGILSLMQMPRTTAAIQALREERLPYIVVLTNPTTGGVAASYAMLGDVHIAEPGAVIGFAGRRVIEQTIREKLPDNFQRAEYLKDHGMIDMVVHRHQLRPVVARICRLLASPADIEVTATPPPEALPVAHSDLPAIAATA